MSLTEVQLRLLRHKMRGWVAGDFLQDFDRARERAVASRGGGTYYLDTERTDSAWSETTSKGYAVRRAHNEPAIVSLTWPEVRQWAQAVPAATRERIIELGREIREVMSGWQPYTYRPRRDDESREEYDEHRKARYAEVSAHNDAVRATARPLEEERDHLIDQAMPSAAGEQLDLFGGAA